MGGQLVRAGGGVVGELREEDAEQAVRERGDVPLERIEAAVLRAPAARSSANSCSRSWSVGVVMVSSASAVGVADGRRDGEAGKLVGAPEEPGDERRDPPAQDVEAAADADAGSRKEDLERRHRANEEPAQRRDAQGEGDSGKADGGGPERLGEPRRVFVLELGRRAEP